MRDNQSFRKSSREESMSTIVAAEAQRMVRNAARPVPAGETVKGQLRRACRALGYRDGDWKIRSAWYGEAGSWSAAAFEELRSRYAAWDERNAASAQKKLDDAAQWYAALAERLEATDGEFHRETIARLLDAARQMGGKADRAS